jgi:hypothetical protein
MLTNQTPAHLDNVSEIEELESKIAPSGSAATCD